MKRSKRSKRFTIKLVALGLAVAAIGAAPAQAKLDEGLGVPRQSEPTFAVSPDDRSVNLMQVDPNVVVSPDDRRISRMSPATPDQATGTSGYDFQIGDLGVAGIVLLLGGAATLVAVRQARSGRLASA